jgi:hypothetical protein
MSASGLEADTISVIVCSHTLDRWEHLRACVESVRAQTLAAAQTIVVIDGNSALERRASESLEGVEVLANRHERGLSGARQTGAEHARGSILAFLDDDAVAAPDWLERLASAYQDPLVLGVGGSIDPAWESAPPVWFPAEFNWVVGCTYPGLPTTAAPVRNLIGANMSMRAAVLAGAGAFDARLGRAPGARALSGSAEETELCIRAARAFPGHFWIHEPRARVAHAVPPQRGTWRYFARRCVVEGTAKALLARIAGGEAGLRAERAYVRSVLPHALGRELRSAVRGDAGGLARAGAIGAGLTITAAAYARTWCSPASRRAAQADAGLACGNAGTAAQEDRQSPQAAAAGSDRLRR